MSCFVCNVFLRACDGSPVECVVPNGLSHGTLMKRWFLGT